MQCWLFRELPVLGHKIIYCLYFYQWGLQTLYVVRFEDLQHWLQFHHISLFLPYRRPQLIAEERYLDYVHWEMEYNYFIENTYQYPISITYRIWPWMNAIAIPLKTNFTAMTMQPHWPEVIFDSWITVENVINALCRVRLVKSFIRWLNITRL